MPDLRLHADKFGAEVRHEVDFDITSEVIIESKPGSSRPFTMLATRLHLSWYWTGDEWRLMWSFRGRRYRKTTGDWSPHVQGFMSDWDIDLPDWVRPLIEANAPTAPPVVIVDLPDDEPACRICGCTEMQACPGGCCWVPDPEGKGEICSAHFVAAETLIEGQIVSFIEWHDGDPVRILRAPTPAGEAVEAAVRYQDVTAQRPAVDVLVDRHHLVLPVGGAR
ncbi:hypothetical protein JOL79_11660 [Microbispora sp. RL4-1S]|uniref:Uncharacterized protein n=1 Tax=Microbispora oryzae TaxID=2806554 RepID=A0A941AHU4_9ACTN|nr:hypothetical protein [Microbispora oryzae]MBP2704471.1 hypothetical protein [Microbispora oryzae]